MIRQPVNEQGSVGRGAAVLVLAAGLLSACGGGGGGAADPSQGATVTAASLTSIAPPPGFDFASFRKTGALKSTAIPAAAGFAGPARTYVSLWYLDSSANRQQLTFISLQTWRGLDAQGGFQLQIPANVTALEFTSVRLNVEQIQLVSAGGRVNRRVVAPRDA